MTFYVRMDFDGTLVGRFEYSVSVVLYSVIWL